MNRVTRRLYRAVVGPGPPGVLTPLRRRQLDAELARHAVTDARPVTAAADRPAPTAHPGRGRLGRWLARTYDGYDAGWPQ